MKTILQIANEIGVSKQAVKNKIDKLGLQSTLQKIDNHFAIPKNTENEIKQAFLSNNNTLENAKKTPSERQVNDKLISMLQAELDIKNKQIDDLSLRLAEVTAALTFEQQNAATAQALHGGTMMLTADSSTDERDTQQPKRGLFGIFSKKGGRKSEI